MFRATLNWNEIRDVARLYSTLPVVFTDSIWERLSELLNLLWPSTEDIPEHDKKRQKLASKFARRLDTHEPLRGQFPNCNPFSSHVRAVVRFDLFCQNCVRAGVNPFTDREFKTLFPDLSHLQYGRWIQGSVPDCHNEAINRYFKERLGLRFEYFWPEDRRLSDLTLLALGYLCVPAGDDLCQEEYWAGDRRHAGADKRLLITNLCRSLPIFYWLKAKKWKYNPRTQEFVIADKRFNHAWFLTTCCKWAERRFTFWELRQRLLLTLDRLDTKNANNQRAATIKDKFTW